MQEVLISIEGIDGVGKGTQARQLYERLLSEGVDAELVSFPRYDTFFGKLVGAYLNGDFGALDVVPVEYATLLYALDRWHFWHTRAPRDQPHRSVLVIDRYVPSNIAHQSVKVPAPKKGSFAEWTTALEYEVFSTPKPTVVILLDLPVRLAARQVLKKPRRSYTDQGQDIHERDGEYLQLVRSAFLAFCENDPTARIVKCEDGEAVRPVDDIAAEVWQIARAAICDCEEH